MIKTLRESGSLAWTLAGCHRASVVVCWLLIAAASLESPKTFAAEATNLPRLEFAGINDVILRGFERRAPGYARSRDAYAMQLSPLTEKLIAFQEAGRDMSCSEQIYIETRWLLQYTVNWQRLEAHLDALRHSMQTTDQSFAQKQSTSDGSWGNCYEEWFLKLDATVTALNDLADRDELPAYPLSFLDKLDTPEKLWTYLNSLLISDIARTGFDKREELGAVTGVLSQLLFKDELRRFMVAPIINFSVDEDYARAYRRFLDASQDPETGYWGAWYRDNGKVFKSADLSLTFHTISYRKGEVRSWPQIIDTTLAIKPFEYPYGWMKNGSYNHHNNYDVLKIFRYGWPYMTKTQRERARMEIEAMLNWCLSPPMDPKAPFAVDGTFYANPGNYYYYGVSFFDEIGYWDAAKRFWTDQDFPDALNLCRSIKEQLLNDNLRSPSSRAAMQKLEANCS